MSVSVTDKKIDENFKELMKPRMRVKIIDEVQFCCKPMKKFYESHDDIKFDSIDSVMLHEGKAITECPFCHTNIEVDVSVSHWGGD